MQNKVAVTLLLFFWAGTAASLPPDFSASYTVHYEGMKIGTMRRELTRGDQEMLFSSVSKVEGLASLFVKGVDERSTLHIHQGALRPLKYSYRQKDKNRTIAFDWARQTASSSDGKRSWQLPLRAGLFDNLSYQLAIMEDLSAGKKSPLEYRIADKSSIKTYTFSNLGEESLETPLGRLPTVKLFRQKPGSKRTTTLWCAVDLHFLPVRLENTQENGALTKIVIETLSGAGYKAPLK